MRAEDDNSSGPCAGRFERWLAKHIRNQGAQYTAGSPEKGPSLIRYMFVRTKYLGINVHHLLGSDRDFHDHPCSFISFLLSGSYIEWTEGERGEQVPHLRRRFSLLWRPAGYKHFLELKRPMWTICVRFKYRRNWGFYPNGRFVPWNRYLRDGMRKYGMRKLRKGEIRDEY